MENNSNEFKATDFGRVAAMLLDVMTEVLARQQSLERQMLAILIQNNKPLYRQTMDSFEEKTTEFKDSIYQQLSVKYGDLPPDIMQLVNPGWKDQE